MPEFHIYTPLFNQVIAEAKTHDIFSNIAKHYGNGGGIIGIEAQLVENYVYDSIYVILENLPTEQLNEFSESIFGSEEETGFEATLDDLTGRLTGLFSSWMDENYDLYGNNRNDEDEDGSEEWELNAADREAIDFAIDAAYSLLKKPDITPYQIQGLARAIYALQQLPRFEQDIDVSFGLNKRGGDGSFSESYSFDFYINQDHFKISEHPAVSDSSGTDHSASIIHFVGPLFEREVNDLGYFRNKFYSFLNSSDVWVEDDSDPDVNLDED